MPVKNKNLNSSTLIRYRFYPCIYYRYRFYSARAHDALHAHVLNIIYTDINQQSTDQQRNMPTQYYSSLKSFITFFYKTNEEMTAAQKVENDRMSLVLKYCETTTGALEEAKTLTGG
jgi:hypothetical protein